MMDPTPHPFQWRSLADALNLHGGGVVTLVGAGGKTTLMFALARQLAAVGGPVLTTTTTKIAFPTPRQSPLVLEAVRAEDLLDQLDHSTELPSHFSVLSPLQAEPEKQVGLPASAIDVLAASGRFRWILVEGDGAARKPLKAPAEHEPVIPDSCRQVIFVAGLDGLGRPLTEQNVHRAARFSELSGVTMGAAITADGLARLVNHPAGGRKAVPAGAGLSLFLNKADAFAWQAVATAVRRNLRQEGGGDIAVIVGSARQGRAMQVS